MVFPDPQLTQTWKCVHTLKEHTASVNSVAVSPNGQIFASGSDDRTVTLWNLKTGKRIFTFFGLLKGVAVVALSPDGQMLVSGDFDKTITSWQLSTQAMRSFPSFSGSPYSHLGYVSSIAFTPDGQILASGSSDKTIKIWNLQRWVSTRTLTGHSDTVCSIAITLDSQTLVSGSADHTIRLWQLNSWEPPRILTGHSSWVTSVAISPDGKTLVSGSRDATIKLWNFSSLELLNTLTGHSAEVVSVAISPDGQTLASASTHDVKLWHLPTGELLHTLRGCHPAVFSPDSQTLISGGDGQTIKIWQKCLSTTKPSADPPGCEEWWEVLGVRQDANADDVKHSYRQLIKQYHPDINPSAEAKAKMQAINQAYEQFQKE